MSFRTNLAVIAFLTIAAAVPTARAMEALQSDALEAYPDELQSSLERRARSLAAAAAGRGLGAEYVVRSSRRWPQRRTLTVAFLGGTTQLHQRIATVASEWTEHCNLKLDFGRSAAGTFRSWSTADVTHAADIRVSFDKDGYWSLVGTDSRNAAIGSPGSAYGGGAGQRSMNFGGVLVVEPDDLDATILHEFGHALGFEHEHQHPTGPCESQFRWHDDADYEETRGIGGAFIPDASGRRPGIYTVLGGPPNNWPAFKVDHNLRKLPESGAYTLGKFDRHSIMKYAFPSWMFADGSASACFNATENERLSDQDKLGAWAVYPTDDPPQGLEAPGTAASLRARAAAGESERLAVVEMLEDLASPGEERRFYEMLSSP